MIIDIFSFGAIIGILVGDPTKFAITMTLGNIIQFVGYKIIYR